jgi:ribosomal protein S18 acetylase RimI-like enzyme
VGDEREYRRLEESVQLVREKLLSDVARLSLGIDPPEKSLAVRVELMRALVRHYQRGDGLRKRDLLVPSLFDTTAEEVERGYEEYARLREEFQTLVVRTILLSKDSRSRDILESLAERSRTEVGDLIRRHLGEENPVTGAGGSGTFTEESRGYEGLPNEQYTPGLAEAIDTGSFVAAGWDGRTLKRTPLEHEQRGRIPPKEQKYASRKLLRAEKAVKGLRPEEQAMLEDMIIVFFEGERMGHYSLSRPQLYVNVQFLDAPEALRKILRHELLERGFVVSRLEAAREKGRIGTERGEDAELLAAALGELKHQQLEHEENQTGIAPGEEYRRVSSTGQISIKKGQYSIGQFLAGETVCLRPSLKGSSGDLFDVFYGAVRIGTVRSDREEIEYTDTWRQWRKKLDIRTIRKKAGMQRTVLPSGQITVLDRHYTVGPFLRGEKVRIDVADPDARDPGFSVFYGNIKVGTRAPGESRITFTDGWKAIRAENDGRHREKRRERDREQSAPARQVETAGASPDTGPFELERVIKGGLFILKQLRYTGPTRTVPGGGRLVTGNSYILKVSRLDEHIGDIRREEDIRYFLEPTMRFYRQVNPDNTSPYLPRLIGTAEECGLEGMTDGRVPLFEFVEGKNLRDYLKQLRLYSVRDREVRFLRVVAEMIKGYKEIYFDKEFVHGDIDSTAMVIKTRKGSIERFCFVDNDSAARFDGPDDLDRMRMTAHKKEFASQDRQERLENGLISGKTDLCVPRDDVFSFCTLLINESRALYSRGGEVPSEWMRELRGLLSEYRQYSGLAVTKEGLAEDFLEDITDFVARQLEALERRDEELFTEKLDYMAWLEEGILSDDRSLDVMPADPRDAARIEDLSRNIFADRGRPELTEDVVRQSAGVLREFKKIFVWFRIGGPRGYISIDIERTERGDEQAYIAGIAVDPAHRGEGVAKMLIARAVEELFRERGIRNFCAKVERGNTASRELFKKMGFSGARMQDDREMLFYALCLDEDGRWTSPKEVYSPSRVPAERTAGTGDQVRERDEQLEPYDGPRTPAVYLRWLDSVEPLLSDGGEIRPVLSEDLGEIIHISRAGNSAPDVVEDLEQAVMNEGRDKREVYVREDRGNIGGYIYFHYDNEGAVTIEDAGAVENARSENIMNMLLARVLKEAVGEGTLEAVARIPGDRGDIKSLVERFGFVPFDTSPPPGRREGSMLYRLSLRGEGHVPLTDEMPDVSYRARRKVRALIDSLLIRAYHTAAPGQKMLLGIDTSWVPEMQTEFQALLNELTRISRKKGFGDMIIVRERGAALGRLLRDTAEKEGIPYSNIIVLAAEDIARGDAFDPLRSTETEARAFIAGVDASRISGDCYIDLLGMVRAALDLEGGLAGAADDPDIEMVRTGPRTWLFIPDAVRYDHFRRKQMYAAERDLITSA